MSGRAVPGLTKDEFAQLLARAALRHAQRGPRDFTVAELIEAGQELGIDPATVRDVHLEHQRARERALARPPVRQRPYDSILRLDRDGDEMRLSIPPRLDARLDERVVQDQNGTTRTPFVALDHGTETHELLVGFSRAEQIWAVEEIERQLGR